MNIDVNIFFSIDNDKTNLLLIKKLRAKILS
jgi:hypothetical protein